MKAVIMAGGQGTRLRPLTVNRPKPMLPIVNRPVLEHIIALLRRHGIREIVVTLSYLPHVIRDYLGDGTRFGVSVEYSVEVRPLGTAGSVRKASSGLTETFLVISGDALTDMDLTDLLCFHKEKGSVATMALTRVENPLAYGIVSTDEAGRILRFLEKPSRSEVFSDTANTGIYVLEPAAFDLMEAGKVYDFSRDIFPQLLAAERPMYGYLSRSYWCDIGSPEHYLQAQEDCLTGKVRISIPGEEVRRGVWVGRNVSIDPTAEIVGPAVIGDGAVIQAGAQVGEYSVIGPGAVLDRGAHVSRSVTMSQVYVGQGADVQAALVARGAHLGRRSSVGKGTVVGDETRVGEGAIVAPGTKLWPSQSIGVGAYRSAVQAQGSRK